MNARQAEAQRQDEKVKQRQLREDFKFILSTPAGRRFFNYLWDECCRVQTASDTGNSATYVNEGRRLVGIRLMSEAKALDPDGYLTAMRESIESEVRRESRFAALATPEAPTEDTDG